MSDVANTEIYLIVVCLLNLIYLMHVRFSMAKDSISIGMEEVSTC